MPGFVRRVTKLRFWRQVDTSRTNRFRSRTVRRAARVVYVVFAAFCTEGGPPSRGRKAVLVILVVHHPQERLKPSPLAGGCSREGVLEGDDGQRPSGQDRRRKEEGGGCVRSGKWWLAQFRGGALALALLLLLVARPPIMKLHARSTDRPTQLLPPPFHAALTLLILVATVS